MASLLGHSDKAMRDCLARITREGLLEHLSGRGRSAEYSVTEVGQASIDADLGWTAFAHRVDAGLEPWDGYWYLTGFEIPEARRGARDAIRNLLVELGAAPIQSGLYVYASDLSGFVLQLAAHLRVSETVTSFVTDAIRVGSDCPAKELVNRLWTLAPLADRYAVVEQQLAAVIEQALLIDGDQLAALMFSATLELEAVLRDDPLLPVELLDADWAGSRTRQAFMAAHAAVSTHSELFNNSQLMQSYAAEIGRSLEESPESFWNRWLPRLIEAYKARLPPAATA
jgi:phenylacetic acid degradation operon negative regulatory protein